MGEDSDNYADSRAGLRESAKWYTASLAGLGTLLAGSLSLGILPELGEAYLREGLIVGIGVLVCILLAILLVQEVLFPREFGANELERPVIARALAPFLPRLLPQDIQTLQVLKDKLAQVTDAAELARLRTVRSKVESFAAFLDLRRKVRRTNWAILILFTLACSGIGYLAYLKGKAAADMAVAQDVLFTPGPDWGALAEALAVACPSAGPMAATGKAQSPFAGWWTITLAEPSPCAGAVFSVPAATVVPGP